MRQGALSSIVSSVDPSLHPNLPLPSVSSYLEGPSHAEDPVIRLLGAQTLEGQLHHLALLGDQIIDSAGWEPSAWSFSQGMHCSTRRCAQCRDAYLSPNLRYPALSMYQFDRGCIHLRSHGRLMMKGASDGCDILTGRG